VTLVGVRERHTGVWMGNLTERDSLNDLDIDDDDDDLKGIGLLSTGWVPAFQN
jgi:hypothetical protein